MCILSRSRPANPRMDRMPLTSKVSMKAAPTSRKLPEALTLQLQTPRAEHLRTRCPNLLLHRQKIS